jgi:hypothetical protein
MRIWVVSCLCTLGLVVPSAASAGFGMPEPVESNINQILLAPGGPGFVIGFPASNPSRARFALRPLEGTLESPMEFPAGIGQHTLPTWGFDAAGDAVILDEEVQKVYWRSADGKTTTPQKLEGHLLGRWPRLVSVAPNGDALIGVNELRPGGSPVQLAFRAAGPMTAVDTENTVDLTNKGTLIGLQLQANGGAIAVYGDEETGKLMQVVRRSGQATFDPPTEIASPAGTYGQHELSFSGDPSGWAMLGWSGASAEGGTANQALGTVRAPDGSFPTATVLATGAAISNATPAVTSSGDGLLTWKQNGLGNPECPAFAIRGAAQHLGAWSAAMDVGPSAWPDASIPATASTSFSAGSDISVPMIRVHEEGAPCPHFPQTRSLIVHHYRSGPSGLTDQGTSELTPLSSTSPQQVEGWAMEPAGKIFAWYRVGEERFLRVFDGVTPGPGGSEGGGGSGGGGGAGGGAGGGGGGGASAPTLETPTKVTLGGPLPPALGPPIKPLSLQQFANIPTINPRALEFEMHCPPVGEESCEGRAYAVYLLTGKQIKAYGARSSSAKKRSAVIATGSTTIKPGHSGHIKLHPNNLGEALLRTGAKLKITLKLTFTVGQRSVAGNLPAIIKARGHH